MRIWTFEGGYDRNLTYIFGDESSPAAAVVDAAVPVPRIRQTAESHELEPHYLLITHTHDDHVLYVNQYLDVFPDLEVCAFPWFDRLPNRRGVTDGDTIQLGGLSISVIHTPGHYPDCICFLVNGVLFTGDTLFVGRTGRTVSSASDTRKLHESVYDKILTLPKDTVIYPGHNYGHVRTITLSENVKISPLLQAANEDDFVRRMEDYERLRGRP